MESRSGFAAHALPKWSFACGKFSRRLWGRMLEKASQARLTSL